MNLSKCNILIIFIISSGVFQNSKLMEQPKQQVLGDLTNESIKKFIGQLTKDTFGLTINPNEPAPLIPTAKSGQLIKYDHLNNAVQQKWIEGMHKVSDYLDRVKPQWACYVSGISTKEKCSFSDTIKNNSYKIFSAINGLNPNSFRGKNIGSVVKQENDFLISIEKSLNGIKQSVSNETNIQAKEVIEYLLSILQQVIDKVRWELGVMEKRLVKDEAAKKELVNAKKELANKEKAKIANIIIEAKKELDLIKKVKTDTEKSIKIKDLIDKIFRQKRNDTIILKNIIRFFLENEQTNFVFLDYIIDLVFNKNILIILDPKKVSGNFAPIKDRDLWELTLNVLQQIVEDSKSTELPPLFPEVRFLSNRIFSLGVTCSTQTDVSKIKDCKIEGIQGFIKLLDDLNRKIEKVNPWNPTRRNAKNLMLSIVGKLKLFSNKIESKITNAEYMLPKY